MDSALLKTKFYIPPLSNDVLSRPRLTERLSQNTPKKLTLVSAPAGFGKTVLLSEWVSTLKHPVAWISLDEAENDPSSFWAYFVGALQMLDERFGAVTSGMLRNLSASWQPLLVTLINEIADRMPRFTLVLDDYHLIANPAVHASLAYFIDHMPPEMRLVISSRTDPPLPLAKLRAGDQLAEFRVDDLRFNLAEADALLNNLQKIELSGQDVSKLLGRTEGWIVGLKMAALSLKGATDRSGYVDNFSGSNRYILDYLTDEVLHRQDDKVISFLLQTAFLERLNGELCDFVTDRTDGQQMLDLLEEGNLFIVPLDDERRWYRYHHLFGELLRNQLRKRQPEMIPTLCIRASGWCEQAGYAAEAFQYALSAPDMERAARLSESVALEMVARNRAVTVAEWISRLPETVIENHPALCVAGAWAALSTRRFEAVEKFLRLTLTRLGGDPAALPPEARALYAHVLTLQAFLARFKGEYETAVELSLNAIKYANKADAIVISTATLNLGISYWNSGDLLSGRKYIETASQQAVTAGNYFISMTSIGFLAEIESQLGHLRDAEAICRRGIELGTLWGVGRLLPTTGYPLVALANVLLEQNRLDEAAEVIEQGIELGEASTESELIVRAYIARARLRQISEDYAAAAEDYAKAQKVEPVFPYLKKQIAAWEARLHLDRGALVAVGAWAREQAYLLAARKLNFEEEFRFITLLRVEITTGEAAGALKPLDDLLRELESQQRTADIIEALNLKALALAQLSRTEEALVALERSLELAVPQGFVRRFVDCGTPMQNLLKLTARNNISRDFSRMLLAAFNGGETAETPGGDVLNEQEQSILKLMAAGLSNKDIGAEMYLSLNTVKWYGSRIYAKLGVNNRAEAVQRAHDLNLIS